MLKSVVSSWGRAVGLGSLQTQTQSRALWQWVNMMFNAVDPDRVRAVGPDRACAEWLLRNGGTVSWKDGRQTKDFNLLSDLDRHLTVLDGTDSSISHVGFDHLKGCKYIEKIILNKCKYIDDKAIEELSKCESPLKEVQITHCPNVTENGLRKFPNLPSLETLIMHNLDEVKDLQTVKNYLQTKFPKCDIKTTE